LTTAAKKIKKGEKGKPKDVGHLLFQKLKILCSAHTQAKMLQNMGLTERKACFYEANAFLGRLELI